MALAIALLFASPEVYTVVNIAFQPYIHETAYSKRQPPATVTTIQVVSTMLGQTATVGHLRRTLRPTPVTSISIRATLTP